MTRLSADPKRVFVLGATGTIGRAVVRALVQRDHEVVCFLRPGTEGTARRKTAAEYLGVEYLRGAELRYGDVTQLASLEKQGLRGEKFDAMISCMASRTGVAKDAWAIDHKAHMNALSAATAAGMAQMILLSAICVQKPRLAFQHAKLAFEKALIESGLTYSIVRPTAYFKSLSGQITRVQTGKPFLLFGSGDLTSCKPISDRDLADYIADCLNDESKHNRILPIGGPGDAITPRQQGERLFAMLGKDPHFRSVPVKLFDAVIPALNILGKMFPKAAEKAELARIGRYYATESMLVLNAETGQYDAAATPTTGSTTLLDFYESVIAGQEKVERGDHSVF